MLNPDVEARRMLVREHRVELARDALQPAAAAPRLVARALTRRRLRLLVTLSLPRLRSARSGSLERADRGRGLLEER